MADTKSRGRAADRKRLNMSEPYEVAYAKSQRASPARKALLAGRDGTRSSSSSGDGGTAKPRSTRPAASRSAAPAAKRSTAPAAKRSTGTAATRRSATSGAKRASASAKSAAPAMRRTNADPARTSAKKLATRPAPKPPKQEKTAENTAPKTMKERDAVDLLTDDHLAVGTLFKQYEKLAKKEAPAAQRQSLAQTICGMLKAHTAIEEEIFYPAARRAGIESDLLDEADIEHASAKALIAQIEAAAPEDDHYDAKVKVLGDYVTHHVVEEHTEMFTQCRRSKMDLVALGAELAARKNELQGGAPPADAGDESGPAKSPGLLAKLGDTLFSKA